MLINNWYVLGLSEHVKDQPVGVHALGQDFVLFRDQQQKVHCLSDTCVHRGGSLCRGAVVDGTVECPYHGWRYDGAGQCVEIPSLGPDEKIPKRARVDSYPTDERWGWIWVFLGDLPEAERPPLPEFFPEYGQPDSEWRYLRGEIVFDCNWVRAIENGVDRTHAVWVHTDFGNPERKVPKPFHVVDDNHSLYCRSSSKPLDKRGAWREVIPDNRGERDNVVQIYVPAPSIRIEMHMQPPKSMFIVTAYTPINEHQTRLTFIHSRNFLTDESHDEDTLKRMFLVLNEDAVILNYLKPARVPPTLGDELLLDSDRHGVMFRQKVKAREALGHAIDARAMQGEDDYARVIPSPARRADPKNWVLQPVLMRATPGASEPGTGDG
jgi:phenylpropionate dioxygenase-like ring-hydroxylating dioxygenase large terminal subunit